MSEGKVSKTDSKVLTHVYMIPGLGADYRLFSQLVFEMEISSSVLSWIEPFPNEKISEYALRMCSQIDANHPFILIGVSLGGIMSIEMAKHVNPIKIIIISSIKTKRERPFYFLSGTIINTAIILTLKSKKLLFIASRIFFGKMTKPQFEVFQDMLLKTSITFINWANKAIVSWDNSALPYNIIHIHGTSDFIFPSVFIKNYIPIKGGAHYMIVVKAKEISCILKKELESMMVEKS